MSVSQISHLRHVMDFLSYIPVVGIGCIAGESLVWENDANKILNDEQVTFPPGIATPAAQQAWREHVVHAYGNMSCRAEIQGILSIISAIALYILGCLTMVQTAFCVGAGIAIAILGIYQVERVNAYLARQPIAAHG